MRPLPFARVASRWPLFAVLGAVVAVTCWWLLFGAAQASTPVAKVPAHRALEPGADALFLGDSWTWGYSAEPPTAGMAYAAAEELELDSVVDGVPGTGFVSPGPQQEGTFAERLTALELEAEPDLVVLQGGTNDTESTPPNIAAALTETVGVVEDRWPRATVLVVGPGPRTWPAEDRIGAVDAVLSQAAGENGIGYISPLRERWITEATAPTVLDQSTSHPSTAGHAHLGRELADSIRDHLGSRTRGP